jgi:hypothetical protein
VIHDYSERVRRIPFRTGGILCLLNQSRRDGKTQGKNVYFHNLKKREVCIL